MATPAPAAPWPGAPPRCPPSGPARRAGRTTATGPGQRSQPPAAPGPDSRRRALTSGRGSNRGLHRATRPASPPRAAAGRTAGTPGILAELAAATAGKARPRAGRAPHPRQDGFPSREGAAHKAAKRSTRPRPPGPRPAAHHHTATPDPQAAQDRSTDGCLTGTAALPSGHDSRRAAAWPAAVPGMRLLPVRAVHAGQPRHDRVLLPVRRPARDQQLPVLGGPPSAADRSPAPVERRVLPSLRDRTPARRSRAVLVSPARAGRRRDLPMVQPPSSRPGGPRRLPGHAPRRTRHRLACGWQAR